MLGLYPPLDVGDLPCPAGGGGGIPNVFCVGGDMAPAGGGGGMGNLGPLDVKRPLGDADLWPADGM